MRTLVRNRRRERAAYPQAEARRRKRRAANVNKRRWLDRSLYFLEQGEQDSGWLATFGHLKEGEPGVSPEIAAQVQVVRERHNRLIARADECLSEAQRWEKANPL